MISRKTKVNSFLGIVTLAAAVAFTFQLEGLPVNKQGQAVAYLDINGKPTICAGHTEGVRLGDTMSIDACMALLKKEESKYLEAVYLAFDRPQPMGRIVAFTDFAYNEGISAMQHSQALRLINEGKIEEGCNALMNWTRVGNKPHVLDGRRKVEKQLCLEK